VAIPLLFKVFEHVDSGVRSTAISLLEGLAGHGELHQDTIVDWLTWMYSRASQGNQDSGAIAL
jgi:hypothetical protein